MSWRRDRPGFSAQTPIRERNHLDTDRAAVDLVSCSYCGEDKPTAALPSREDVALCRDCLEWLLGRIGVTSTPTLPVVDMAEAVAFYERAGFVAGRLSGRDGGRLLRQVSTLDLNRRGLVEDVCAGQSHSHVVPRLHARMQAIRVLGRSTYCV